MYNYSIHPVTKKWNRWRRNYKDMSVTVADLMKLPSLKQATVLGGHNGLSKTVASISVLESTNPDQLVDGLFPRDEFFGSEIVITGFLNITHDVERQCANIRKLAEGGEVGLILFYVGVYMPDVNQRLIDLADEMDFVLICMPRGEKSLRYGEVINDVMERIYRDRAGKESIVADILARMSNLPQHLQSVNTVLKMLSDRITATVALVEGSGEILNLVTWPRNIEPVVKEGLKGMKNLSEEEEQGNCLFLENSRQYSLPVAAENDRQLRLLIIKEGDGLTDAELDQSADVVRISMNIWSRQHGEIAIHELVRAIIQDEPMKMRRLADIFRIDVASIQEMWIIREKAGDTRSGSSKHIPEIRSMLDGQSSTVMVDVYEENILIFLSSLGSLRAADQLSEELVTSMEKNGADVTLVRCPGLKNTTDVRQAYLSHDSYLEDTVRIYPTKRIFTLSEIQFAEECRRRIQLGEHATTQYMEQLMDLQKNNEELSVAETLGVYLLDTGCSVTKTASILYLHVNTVKYRIGRISDIIGYRPDKMPENFSLFLAVALYRLLK